MLRWKKKWKPSTLSEKDKLWKNILTGMIGFLLVIHPVRKGVEVLANENFKHDIRPVLAYLQTHWKKGEPIKVFEKSANELNYYNVVYPDLTHAYKEFIQHFNRVETLPLLQPTWFLFTSIDAGQRQQLLEKLGGLGKITIHISQKRSFLYQVTPK